MPPQAPSAAAVVPSSDPPRDARSLARLVGPRFVRPNDEGSYAGAAASGAVILASDDDDGSSIAPTAVLFVDFGPGRQPQQVEEVAAFAAPNSTLMVTADLIASVTKSGVVSEEDATIRCSANGDHSWAAIRLSGGGTLLLASSVQAVYGYASDATNEDVSEKKMANGLVNGIVESATAVEEPPYKFPSLAMSVLSNKQVIPGFQINTRVGVPIESDLFVGQVLLMMRPPNPNDDPYYNEKVFSKKKRRLEIQIQGKFKYVPSGTVWCGFEVTEEMKLGLVARGLCNLLLRLVSKTVPGDMHFSFGDKNNEELAHISFPAWTIFDKLVVTKPGEEPPPLGDVFPELAKDTSRRKRSGLTGDWNTVDTYSFSYHSMYLDLPIWHVVNLPTADMDLKTFWRDSLLRIVVYESEKSTASEGKHLQAENKYIAGIQAEYLGFEDKIMNDMLEENDSIPLDQRRLTSISRSMSNANFGQDMEDVSVALSAPSSLGGWDVSTIEESDGEETIFHDATEELGTESENDNAISEGLEGGQVLLEMNSFDKRIETSFDSQNTPDNMLLYDMLCPGWIDVCLDQKGKYTKVYAFANAGECGTDENVIFRTGSEFAQLFPLSEAKRWAEESCSPRLSGSERHRRIMGYTLAACRHASSPRSQQRCRALWNQRDFYLKDTFLQRASPSDTKVKKEGVLFSGYVARALSERHWVEEWAMVTDRLVLFYHPHSKRPSYRIRLKGILGAKELEDRSECPYFPSYLFLAVETISRVIYIMFRSREGCRNMLDAIRNRLHMQEEVSPTSHLSPSTFDDPSGEYLHKSSLYKCDQRRLLNNRKFAFDSYGKIGFEDREGTSTHPLALVQDALRKVLAPNLMDVTDRAVLDDFLDAASELKRANLSGLSEAEKLAFYINLYHVMVMHGFLVFGAPLTPFEFVNYFGKVAYEVDDDIVSLKELEHNILRANMTAPCQFIGRFVLPKQVYRHALRKGDYRVNFALDCGSFSNPGAIPVYAAEDLDSQLDEASREYLKAARISSSGRSLTLPKMCQWYANDFGAGRNQDVVQSVMKYLREEDRRLLPSSLSEVRVRHLGFEYKCRHLKLAGT